MCFAIRFLKEPEEIPGLVVDKMRLAVKGEIVLGEYRETFYSPLDVWERDIYEAQWRATLERLRGGAMSACFVISVHPRDIAEYVEIWGVWRLTHEYRVQNRNIYVQSDALPSLRNVYDLLGSYISVGGDGDPIIGWSLPLDVFR